jgi:hypothetical protein
VGQGVLRGLEGCRGVAEVHERGRAQPAHDALPDVVQRAGRDAVELGQHLAAVVLDVEYQGPPQAGQGHGLVASRGLQLEDPDGQGGEALGRLRPPRDLSELDQASELAGEVASGPKLGGGVLQSWCRTLGVGLDGHHRSQQACARSGAHVGREPGEPLRQHVAGHGRVRGAEGLDNGLAELVPRLGVD